MKKSITILTLFVLGLSMHSKGQNIGASIKLDVFEFFAFGGVSASLEKSLPNDKHRIQLNFLSRYNPGRLSETHANQSKRLGVEYRCFPWGHTSSWLRGGFIGVYSNYASDAYFGSRTKMTPDGNSGFTYEEIYGRVDYTGLEGGLLVGFRFDLSQHLAIETSCYFGKYLVSEVIYSSEEYRDLFWLHRPGYEAMRLSTFRPAISWVYSF